MARLIRLKRGLLADIPTLYEGEPAVTTDPGAGRLYIGTPDGNVRLARYDELPTVPYALPAVQFVYTSTIGSNATTYTTPGLGTNNATESNVATVFMRDMTVKNLRVRVVGNALATLTTTIRKNSGDTSLTCQASGGGTGGDYTHSVDFQGNSGTDDTFSIKLVTSSSGYAITAIITFEIYPS